jgi:hypothetical protein
MASINHIEMPCGDPQAAVSVLLGTLDAVLGRMTDRERTDVAWHLASLAARLDPDLKKGWLH